MKKKNNTVQKNKSKSHPTASRRKSAITTHFKKEEKYRTVLENIEDSYYEIDLAGNFKFFNSALCRLSGCSEEELMGMNYRQYTDKKNSKILFKIFTGVYKTAKPFQEAQWQVIRKDGAKRYLEGSASLIKDSSGRPVGFRGIVHDITGRKSAEKLLRQREAQYRFLADHMKDQIWLMDFNFKLFYVSPSVEKLWGYTLEELNTIAWDNALLPETLEKVMVLVAQVTPVTMDSPDKLLDRSVEIEIRCKDGRRVWEEIRCSFIRDESGKAVSILGVGRDVTERKQMEISLKKSEERYRSVFENSGLPMMIMEDSLLVFMVNDRFVEMSGYGKKEIEDRMKFTDFITSGDLNELMQCFSRRKGDQPVEYECRIAHRNGNKFDVLTRIGRIPEAGQFIASFTDITARKQVELALLENQEHLQKENIRLRSSIRERYRFCDIIGKSGVMQDVYEFILQAAATQANVIIYGESGTGKELVAKAIHETGDRSKKNFVTVHCGAIPETLMESEFFGYKKGSFTGANMDRTGYLDEADGGTLFLDEVGEIGLNMQVKLLRAIAGDGYTPVGGNIVKHADIRIIAATNRNLRDLVKQGVMREDFFYRIHILPTYLPPLRDRKDDLPLLIDHFLDLYDRNHPPLPGHIAEALLNYDWPGNIRELQNVLHRYLTLNRLDFAGAPQAKPDPAEKITRNNKKPFMTGFPSDKIHFVPEQSLEDHGNMLLEDKLNALERDHILTILAENNWHRARTASALGINRKTLFVKMQKFGLTKT
jgi:PAS domain S-box-containing protein